MPDKISLSIDLLKLQGAELIKSTKSGEDILCIRIPHSRVKLYQKKNGEMAVYLKLEAVQSCNLRDEDTHFIVEPTTSQERQEGLKLPILGNGREYLQNQPGEWGGGNQQGPPRRQSPPPRQETRPAAFEDEQDFNDGVGDDDIPF